MAYRCDLRASYKLLACIGRSAGPAATIVKGSAAVIVPVALRFICAAQSRSERAEDYNLSRPLFDRIILLLENVSGNLRIIIGLEKSHLLSTIVVYLVPNR